jgi:hypothetical protein
LLKLHNEMFNIAKMLAKNSAIALNLLIYSLSQAVEWDPKVTNNFMEWLFNQYLINLGFDYSCSTGRMQWKCRIHETF